MVFRTVSRLLGVWKRWTARTAVTDYKNWRITPASTFTSGKGWSPDLRITAIDAPDITHHFPPERPKFFASKAEADGYATNMGIALIDTALGGWRIPSERPSSASSPRTD
jgi:hypothetical protein